MLLLLSSFLLLFFPSKLIERAYDQEDDERNDEEVDNIVYEKAVVERGSSGSFRFGESRIGFGRSRVNDDKAISEVYLAGHEADERVDEVIHDRVDNARERGSDHHCYSKLEGITLHRELSEFL